MATATTVPARGAWPTMLTIITRYFAVLALALICAFFAMSSQAFFTHANAISVLGQGSLLAIVATGMAVVIRAGGIDLSVGVASDIGALVSVSLLESGYVAHISVWMGLVAGAVMGLLNGLVIVYLKVSPFLATLSMLFIGSSIQRVVTGGGEPIYLAPSSVPADFSALGRGSFLGLPGPVWVAAAVLVVGYVLLERLRLGRELTGVGTQLPAAVMSGINARRVTVSAHIFSSTICALAGIVMASRLTAYVPLSGDYYLLDAIGAVFIGTTLHKESRPNIAGTLLGVLIFTVLANGLNLIGLSFYWQGLARGTVLLLVLGLSVVLSKRRRSGAVPRPKAALT